MHPANRPQAEIQMIEGRNSATPAITAPVPVHTSNPRLFRTSSVPQTGQCGNRHSSYRSSASISVLPAPAPRCELIRIFDPVEFPSAPLSLPRIAPVAGHKPAVDGKAILSLDRCVSVSAKAINTFLCGSGPQNNHSPVRAATANRPAPCKGSYTRKGLLRRSVPMVVCGP